MSKTSSVRQIAMIKRPVFGWSGRERVKKYKIATSVCIADANMRGSLREFKCLCEPEP